MSRPTAKPGPEFETQDSSQEESLRAEISSLGLWVAELEAKERESLSEHKSELKSKFRSLLKIKSEVDLMKNERLTAEVTTLATRVQELRNRAMGLESPPEPQAPKETPFASGMKPLCVDGSECNSQDPKHFVEFVHFGNARAEKMISAQKGQERDVEARMSRNKERREKTEEDCLSIEERERRLQILLKKTESYMKTLTRRIRKNCKQALGNKQKVVSCEEVRDFLSGQGEMRDQSIEQTKSLVGGTLKDYQKIGLRWMVSLNHMRLNGILADEMGLGKTVQVCALLAYQLDTHNTRGPHLVVAPLSTLSSWTQHLETWLPALRIYMHRGDQETRHASLRRIRKEGSHDVVLTTYEMAIRDEESLEKYRWNYLIVDEAHRIKNKKSRLFATLNGLSTRHRLLLTGTPLQNNLNELWSLLNFILPQLFDSVKSFEEWFCTPFANEKMLKKDPKLVIRMTDEERLMIVDRLHRAIDPFLLRRVKRDVLPSMAKKEEIVIKCPLSGPQVAVYHELQTHQALWFKDESRITRFSNIMLQLRKCSSHPYLFRQAYDVDDTMCAASGKLVLLDHLLPKMRRFNHRVLIFCQFLDTMDVLSEYLEWRGVAHLRIDGTTSCEERISHLEKFNASKEGSPDDTHVFLLSTRACGLGLNLYTADTVIIYDSDWNPQMDLQAQARAHRIGQKREVRVFRLLSEGSVEEQMYSRAQQKLDLERKAIECGKFDFSMSGGERKEFLESVLQSRVSMDLHCLSEKNHREVNKLLARNAEEEETFHEMDLDHTNHWVALSKDTTLPPWLLPVASKRTKALPKKRPRKRVNYAEDALAALGLGSALDSDLERELKLESGSDSDSECDFEVVLERPRKRRPVRDARRESQRRRRRRRKRNN